MADKATTVAITETKAPSGARVLILRFSGDITSASKAAVLGTYEGLPKDLKHILLDFRKVDYLNSSGIALVIQMLMQAVRAGQSVQTFGLTPHFQKVFTLVGITKYTELHATEEAACAAISDALDSRATFSGE